MLNIGLYLIGCLFCSTALSFTLASQSFNPFTLLGKKYICADQGGANTSPQLSWTDVPAKTKSLLLFMHDPDARHVAGFVHWIVYINDPKINSLQEAHAAKKNPNITFGLNGKDQVLYFGSCPPANSGTHRYNFTLYALNTKLNKSEVSQSHQNDLINHYSNNIIAQTVLTGFYTNK